MNNACRILLAIIGILMLPFEENFPVSLTANAPTGLRTFQSGIDSGYASEDDGFLADGKSKFAYLATSANHL